jgi:hypothetical protein
MSVALTSTTVRRLDRASQLRSSLHLGHLSTGELNQALIDRGLEEEGDRDVQLTR